MFSLHYTLQVPVCFLANSRLGFAHSHVKWMTTMCESGWLQTLWQTGDCLLLASPLSIICRHAHSYMDNKSIKAFSDVKEVEYPTVYKLETVYLL